MSIPIRQYWTLLHRYLRPQWRQALSLALLLLVDIGLKLLNPQIVRFFIDTVLGGGPQSALLNAALLFLGIAVLIQFLSVATTYLGENVAWRATNALRLDLVKHCLGLDQSFHKSHTPGELLERVDGDVNALSNFFSRFLIRVVGNMVLMLGILVLLFIEDWRVSLGMALFAGVALLLLVRIRTIAVPYWAQVRQMSAEFFGLLGELFIGMEDIRANGATGYALRRFHEVKQQWYPVQFKAQLAGYTMWVTNVGVFALGNTLAFGMSAYLWYAEGISIGTVYLIFQYTELLRGPISQIRDQIEDLQQAEASIERIRGLLATQSKLADGASELSKTALPTGALSVAFRDVNFGYDEEEIVLRNISFNLESGRVLGLLGRTGSGKTTVARLLLRLYDPDDGSIRLGGLPPDSLPLAQLREGVAMVTQDVQLIRGTVRDNLTFFNREITDAQLLAVIDELGLSDWLDDLEQGLDTPLSDGSSGLSAGQAQLLAFARVFLRDPGLVILDEASSRLDPATERLIERAVDKLLAGRTAILIAHHLSTVQRADEIMILEEGRIVEHGNRIVLANTPSSRFAQLLQTGMSVEGSSIEE